ncbi:hypothetical protein JCM19039_4455 [Geomicrobium sp. JCM 19039]|nr:hypothetical protein JCM19039_4455 [Geomicrobium sp. JCM 19039]
MFFHPELDIESLHTIGLWFDDDEVVGLATYDHYNGEAFFATLTAYKSLGEQLLEYVIANFQDKAGLGIAVNDANEAGIALLKKYNFVIARQSEQVLACDLENADLHYDLHPDFQLHNLQPENDLYEHHEVLWEGFENDGPLPLDEKTLNVQKRMLTAPHLESSLHIVAKNEAGFAAYCGGWYDKTTDYAYIEPLCTKPAYRKLGLGKALVLETLHRCG